MQNEPRYTWNICNWGVSPILLCRSSQTLSGWMGSVAAQIFSGLSRDVWSGSALAGPLRDIQRLVPKPLLRCLGCVLRVVVLLEGEPLSQSEVLSTLEQVFIQDLCTLLCSSFRRSWLVSRSLPLKNLPTAWCCYQHASTWDGASFFARFVWAASSRKSLGGSKILSFKNDWGHCSRGPSMLHKCFGTLPQICVSTQCCLGALRTIPSTSWLGFCSDMHCQLWDLLYRPVCHFSTLSKENLKDYQWKQDIHELNLESHSKGSEYLCK